MTIKDDNEKQQMRELIEEALKEAGLQNFVCVDPDDLAERIILAREKAAQTTSEPRIRGWAFRTVREDVYKHFHNKKMADEKEANTHQLKLAYGKYAELLPAWIVAYRDGKPQMVKLDYAEVFQEDIDLVIAREAAEIDEKTVRLAGLRAWRSYGIRMKKLKKAPKEDAA